jgi:hypothetical protein
VYKQILINAKLQIGKRGQKTVLAGRSPVRRQRSTSDCNAIEEEGRGREMNSKHPLNSENKDTGIKWFNSSLFAQP